MPSKSSYICGNHFLSGRPTDPPESADYIPSQFPTNHITKPKTEKDQKRFQRAQKRQEKVDQKVYFLLQVTKIK